MNPRQTIWITLAIICTLAMFSTGVAQVSDGSPLSKHITESDIRARYDRARSYAQQGKFELALADYLFVFDNSRGVAGYGGVRLSFLPRAIAEMGEAYPPARKALKDRRDEREELILVGRAGFNEVHELRALNRCLDESSRNLELFDKLKKMGPAYNKVKDDMLDLIWEELVEARRYDDLGDKTIKFARQVATRIAESRVNADFPIRDDAQHQRFLHDNVIQDGSKVFEVLLSLGKTEIADKLLNWLLDFASDGEMFGHLIDRATRSGHRNVARELVERARKTLTRKSDLTIVEEAESRIPKTE